MFDIWGDEIAYDHQVVGKLTTGPTTLRDRVEKALYGVSDQDDKEDIADLEKEIQELEVRLDFRNETIKVLQAKVKELETKLKRK